MKYFLKNKLSIITLLLMISSLITNSSFKNTKAVDLPGYDSVQNGTDFINTQPIDVSTDHVFSPRWTNSTTTTVSNGFVYDMFPQNYYDNTSLDRYPESKRVPRNYIFDSEIQKGNSSVYYTNTGFYLGKSIDIKITVLDYIKHPEFVKKNLPSWAELGSPGWKTVSLSTLGFQEIKLKYEFFDNNNKQPIEIVGYQTYGDIDGQQKLTIYDQNIKNIYVTPNSRLYYKQNLNSLDVYSEDNDQFIPNNDPDLRVQIDYKGKDVIFGFGSYHDVSNNYQVLTGGSYLSVDFKSIFEQYAKPQKSIQVGNNEFTDTTITGKEDIIYNIRQEVIDNGKKLDTFKLTDNIDSRLYLKKIKIFNTANNFDLTNRFQISNNNNLIEIKANSDLLAESSFYGKNYTFQIVTTPKLLNYNPIFNKAQSCFNDYCLESNQVKTNILEPLVISKKEILSEQKLPVQIGDEVKYLITAENIGKGTSYQNLITDKLDSRYEFVSADKNVIFENGEITWQLGDLKYNQKEQLIITLRIKDNALGNDLIPNTIEIKNDDIISPEQPIYPEKVPVLNKPFETVSDENEKKVITNLIESNDKSFIYHTTQLIPTQNINSIIFSNEINSIFEIGNITVTDSNNNDLTDQFKILKNYSLLTAISQNLQNHTGKEISLNIELKLKEDIDLSSYLSQNNNQYEFLNKSSVRINHILNSTNDVKTILPLPIPQYIADEKYPDLVIENKLNNFETEYFNYVIYDSIIDNHNTFKNYEFINQINNSLKINNIKILNQKDQDLTDQFQIDINNNLISAKTDPENFYKSKDLSSTDLRFIINLSVSDLNNLEKLDTNTYKVSNYSTIKINDSDKISNNVSTELTYIPPVPEIFVETGTKEKIITLISLLILLTLILILRIQKVKGVKKCKKLN